MSDAFLIRGATPGDVDAIARYNEQLAWETEHRRLAPGIIRAGVAAVVGDRAKGEYFVAVAGGDRVIGQCSVTYEWSDWRNGNLWWLQSVYVASDWRGRGVFGALFDHVREAARTAGAAGLRLYVEEENTTAQAVYLRRRMIRTAYQVFELEFGNAPV